MATASKISDSIALAIFQSSIHSIAEEMGAALRRTSISPNIKERRDYSCAVFDAQRRVIAMGDHMPVHLGSMPMSVKVAVESLTLERGDVVILNDPYAGGTHLPDITLVVPVFVEGANDAVFYVAARAHHADVGGTFAGSMGPGREIYQEGIRIPPIRIVRGGVLDREVLSLILHNVRTPVEREGDLAAQIGACQVGERRLHEIVQKYGLESITALTEELLDYSDRLMRSELHKMPAGTFIAEDFLDDDGVSDDPIRIAVSIRFEPADGSVVIDFAGSSPQVGGSVNAVYAITYSACFYVLRCLLQEDAPATAGLMYAATVLAPEGTIVNARPPAAVAGGNVETSQRIVDVLLRALGQAAPERVPAASYGTMSNLTIGGIDHRTNQPFTYYETTAGGMGARPGMDGISGVHCHMTNSLNTPIEALEYAYPFRVRSYSYRGSSGGEGEFRGGDGLIREIELLDDAQVTLICERRKFRPYGLAGGEPGASGNAALIDNEGNKQMLPSKCSVSARKGNRIRIETPGGGGWGDPANRSADVASDLNEPANELKEPGPA
jgi:N-methylhydantoinase B